VLAAEEQALEEHVVAARGVLAGEPERLAHPAVRGPDRVAAAGGGLVVAEHGERTATLRMPEPVGDRPLATPAADRLHVAASPPPVIREQPAHELRLARRVSPD